MNWSDPPGGAPEWVTTYGDLMSLLLTFFVLLASMSELKDTEKYQGVAESLQERFGYDDSWESPVAGEHRPHNSRFSALALSGRSRRRGNAEGTAREPSATGTMPRVQTIRPGMRTAVGTTVPFDARSTELSPAGRAALDAIAPLLRGKPQKIELRGHAPPTYWPPDQQPPDWWDLAYRRARQVMDYLATVHGLDPQRMRISVAGPYEPLARDRPEASLENARVEVCLLDEVAGDLRDAAIREAASPLSPEANQGGRPAGTSADGPRPPADRPRDLGAP